MFDMCILAYSRVAARVLLTRAAILRMLARSSSAYEQRRFSAPRTAL
jgi:hypothetical protein